jgi:hypothetical protein
MSRPKKKRTKSYKPHGVRIPAWTLKALPDLSEAQRATLMLKHRAAFDALLKGEMDTPDAFYHCRSAIAFGWTFAAAFKDTAGIRYAIVLGLASLDVMYGWIKEQKSPPPEFVTAGARIAMDYVDEMINGLKRDELFAAMQACGVKGLMERYYARDRLLPIDHEDPSYWRKAIGHVVIAVLNGKVRQAILRERNGRALFEVFDEGVNVVPDDDVLALVSDATEKDLVAESTT